MWREFFADLRAQKLRTSLTVLGIAWGTVAVVVLLAFGVGLERQTRKRFHGLGDRIVILWGGRTTKPFAGFGDGRPIRLQELQGIRGLRIRKLEDDKALQDALLSIYHVLDFTFGGPAVKIVENHLGARYVRIERQVLVQQVPGPPE